MTCAAKCVILGCSSTCCTKKEAVTIKRGNIVQELEKSAVESIEEGLWEIRSIAQSAGKHGQGDAELLLAASAGLMLLDVMQMMSRTVMEVEEALVNTAFTDEMNPHIMGAWRNVLAALSMPIEQLQAIVGTSSQVRHMARWLEDEIPF